MAICLMILFFLLLVASGLIHRPPDITVVFTGPSTVGCVRCISQKKWGQPAGGWRSVRERRFKNRTFGREVFKLHPVNNATISRIPCPLLHS